MKKSLVLFAVSCLSLCALGQAVTTPKYTEFYYQRESLFNVLPVDSTNIVMLGNSLTNGAEWHELFNNPKIINRGINGDTAQGIKDRLTPVTSGHPAKIFLLTGANDISHHLTADSIANAIVDLVETIQEQTPTTKLYVQSILPINNSFGRYKNMIDKEQVVVDVNNLLQPRLEALGVTWLNVNPLFADENGNLRLDYTNDGLHLLGPAYLVWRDFLLPYINE
ncbi:MAG: sialate O-acetylesterase [Muribaculaceae bacterium]|nr:sialate O-acetylesterase [Muribaculaceae bacterium]